MKKKLVLALALCLLLCLAGCATASSETADAALRGKNQKLETENKRLSGENKKLRQTTSGAEITGNAENDNPIDQTFQPQLSKAETTADIYQVAVGWRDAWKAELTAFVRDMERKTKDTQDRADLENYLKTAESQAEVLEHMVYLIGAGADVPRADRPGQAGTAAPAAIALSAEKVYRDAFFALYAVRYPGDANWTWHYQGSGTAAAETQPADQDG